MHRFLSDGLPPLARLVAVFINVGHVRKWLPESDSAPDSKKRRIHTFSEIGLGSRRRLFERLSRHQIPQLNRSGDRGSLDDDEGYWDKRNKQVLCLCVVAAEGRPLEDLSCLDSLEKVVAFQWWLNLGSDTRCYCHDVLATVSLPIEGPDAVSLSFGSGGRHLSMFRFHELVSMVSDSVLEHGCRWHGKDYDSVGAWLHALRDADIARVEGTVRYCFVFPEVAELLRSGDWHSLSCHHEVPHQEVPAARLATVSVAWSDDMKWEHADLFAMKLAAWREHIPESEHTFVEAAVRFLFTAGTLFQPSGIDGQGAAGGLRNMWPAIRAIETVMLSMMVRRSNTLSKVMERSLGVLLPAKIADMVWASVKKVTVMSAAVITRWRFSLDMAFMLYTRRRNREIEAQSEEKRTVRTVCTDSSPQGLENWQITEVWTILDAVATAAVFFEILDMQKSLPEAGRYADLS